MSVIKTKSSLKQLIPVIFISTIFYIATQMVPIEMKWLYELSHYGSLPWSYPWLGEPNMACLDECGGKARYVGFVINAVILATLAKGLISRFKNN